MLSGILFVIGLHTVYAAYVWCLTKILPYRFTEFDEKFLNMMEKKL